MAHVDRTLQLSKSNYEIPFVSGYQLSIHSSSKIVGFSLYNSTSMRKHKPVAISQFKRDVDNSFC